MKKCKDLATGLIFIKGRKTMNRKTIQIVTYGIWGVMALLMMSPEEVPARIPEPDNIIYGIAGEGVVSVSLKVDSEVIASYTMGENPEAGGHYILRVPMDSLDPARPGTAQTGSTAAICVNENPEPVAVLTLGERGTIYRLDFNDTDGDGMADDWEQQIVDANPDFNSIDDVDPNDDFDGDGETNAMEYNNGTDPTDIMSARLGDIDGDKYLSLEDSIRCLKSVSNVDQPGDAIEIEGDIDGDGKLGLPEAIFILRRISSDGGD